MSVGPLPSTWKAPPLKLPNAPIRLGPTLPWSACQLATVFKLNCNDDHMKWARWAAKVSAITEFTVGKMDWSNPLPPVNTWAVLPFQRRPRAIEEPDT